MATNTRKLAASNSSSGIVRVPITNVYGDGDYTAAVQIGSKAATVNLILDTGSSTIAVDAGTYDPAQDSAIAPTVYVQDIIYGSGGWAGPLVKTNVSLGGSLLKSAYLAIADDALSGNFGDADGILGLAYATLNEAYNLTTYLQEQNISPAVTYPWPFPYADSSAGLAQFQSILEGMPTEDITPYFDQLQSRNSSTANMFAFYTLRSFVSMATDNPLTDPLNKGFFILGGGPEQTDLYTGSFVNVDVLDDAWYNVNLISTQVGAAAVAPAAALPARYKQTMITNAIVDSGTNGLAVASDVYKSILAGFKKKYPKLYAIIEKCLQNGGAIATSQLKLSQWPNINFTLTGETGTPVTLTVTPQNYWQMNAPAAGEAIFNIASSGMPQSILGLPLMNGYFTVFDRSQDHYGVIRFAPIKV